MDMKNGVILLLIVTGMTLFTVPLLQAKDQSSSSAASSACDAFGIQRFEEKKIAPPFTLKSLDGNPIALSDFKGKPVLLVFWATWCTSCVDDLQLLEKFCQGKSASEILRHNQIDRKTLFENRRGDVMNSQLL